MWIKTKRIQNSASQWAELHCIPAASLEFYDLPSCLIHCVLLISWHMMRRGRDQEWQNIHRSQSLSWKARLTCRTSVFCLCLCFLCCSFPFSPGLPLICVQCAPIRWLFLSQKRNSFSLRCLDLMCHAPQRVCSRKNPMFFFFIFLRPTMVQSTCQRVAEGR